MLIVEELGETNRVHLEQMRDDIISNSSASEVSRVFFQLFFSKFAEASAELVIQPLILVEIWKKNNC